MDDFALLKLLQLFWRTEALLLFAIYGGSPTITLTEMNGRTKCKSVEQWQNCGRRKRLAYNPKDPWSVSSLVLLERYAVYLFLNQATIDPRLSYHQDFFYQYDNYFYYYLPLILVANKCKNIPIV